ncbi:putative epoxide hydrolase [Bombardia bombarda]|uniref:Epoxide hydrolase n=1 Tax=Bombardia bombarda TaxID=252184 RepID=A0AA40C9R3_9PEZI|nr:putative epoxide hydrolase [Bombardia bombarda]
MASLAFPTIAKKATLSDGSTYGYAAVTPASPQKPTFLLLHGYPSSSYDWRHQIASLSAAGFGVIAPDLLGYGDTDAPEDVPSYRMKRMTGHMSELLDHEGVSRCIAVGHDWGSGLLSRLATYIPDRLLGVIFLSVGYLEPQLVWDIEFLIEYANQAVGYDIYGYWLWHGTEQAIEDCDKNPASVFNLLYPADPADWKVHFAPRGAAANYVSSGRTDPLPSWFNLAEYTQRDRIIAMKGHRGPLNWYKAGMAGINLPDEAGMSEEERRCNVPTLLVVSEYDYITRADMQSANTIKWTPDLRVEKLECGHWIQLEKPDELQRLFERFAGELVVKEEEKGKGKGKGKGKVGQSEEERSDAFDARHLAAAGAEIVAN